MAIYSLLLLVVLVAGAPYWLARMLTSGRYRAGLRGRLGRVPEGLKRSVAGRTVLWIHAVSVGEVMAATRLAEELHMRLGDKWLIAISTTTETGQRLAKQRLGGMCPVFYFPLDFKWVIRRYLRVIQPKLMVLMESELWPRLIWECSRTGVPVAVVNARVSDRSFPRYMRLRRLWEPLLRRVSLFLAQSDETAERLLRMGVQQRQVRMMGNLKYDVRTGEATKLTQYLGSLLKQRRLIVAGSTLPDEETMLLEALRAIQAETQDAMLLIAPRHPDRFTEVEELIRRSGYTPLRCSKQIQAKETVDAEAVLLLDTIGDLASMYSLGAVAFVGGSLAPKGGHNPLEPAQFGVPVVMGESYENFKEIVGTMQSAEAIRIVKRNELGAALLELLRDHETAAGMGRRGKDVFAAQAGATGRTVEALVGLLEERVGE